MPSKAWIIISILFIFNMYCGVINESGIYDQEIKTVDGLSSTAEIKESSLESQTVDVDVVSSDEEFSLFSSVTLILKAAKIFFIAIAKTLLFGAVLINMGVPGGIAAMAQGLVILNFAYAIIAFWRGREA